MHRNIGMGESSFSGGRGDHYHPMGGGRKKQLTTLGTEAYYMPVLAYNI